MRTPQYFSKNQTIEFELNNSIQRGYETRCIVSVVLETHTSAFLLWSSGLTYKELGRYVASGTWRVQSLY